MTAVAGPHGFLEELKREAAAHDGAQLAFDESYSPTHKAFRAMAEDLRFDVCELALATYLQARAAGRPLTILPVTLVGRFQHEQLVHAAGRGPLTPTDLEGARVGVRSYSQTTGVWLRAILRRQYGVGPEQISWFVFEDSHVRGLAYPPNVTLLEDENMVAMFEAGRLDALIGAEPEGGDIRPVIDAPAEAAKAWYEEVGCVTINHLLTVREDVLERRPDTVEAVYRRFRDAVAGRPRPAPPSDPAWAWLGDVELQPVGYAGIHPALRLMADEVHRQGIVSRPLSDGELVHPLVRGWN